MWVERVFMSWLCVGSPVDRAGPRGRAGSIPAGPLLHSAMYGVAHGVHDIWDHICWSGGGIGGPATFFNLKLFY